MKKSALIFVGQGAQQTGMGKDVYTDFPQTKILFDEACEILGFDLKKIMFEGPQETLTESKNAQPALLLHAFCIYDLVKGYTEETAYFAGHSLGEYTAHAAAGAIEFGEALKLVRKRGELMSEAGAKMPGKMAAIVGLSPQEVEKACSEAGGIAVPANYNSPSQIVISGESDAVERAVGICKSMGAKKCVFLDVSAAFHSPLMKEAAQKFSEVVGVVSVKNASKPVLANVSALPVSSPGDLKAAMMEQMTGPVKWLQTIRFLKENGVERAIEFSPKPVLSSLVKKTENEIETVCLSGTQSVNEFIKENGG